MAVTINVGPRVLLILGIKDEVVHMVPCCTLSTISWLSLHIECIFTLSIICICIYWMKFWSWTQHSSAISVKASIIRVMAYTTRLIEISSKIYVLASIILLAIFALYISLIARSNLPISMLEASSFVSHWIVLIGIISWVLSTWQSSVVFFTRTEIVWNDGNIMNRCRLGLEMRIVIGHLVNQYRSISH